MRKKPLTLIILGLVTIAAGLGNQFSSISQPKHSTHQQQQTTMHKQSNKRSYQSALRDLWTRVYKNKGTTLYCDREFSTVSQAARTQADVNAEHIFPMSWVTKSLNCGTRKECQRNSAQFREIESDLHNIYPAKRILNKARSNFRFGTIKGEKRQFGACDFEVDPRKRIAEPADIKRGEIARAMLYMAERYSLPLHKKTQQLMQHWDQQDPPNSEEKRRQRIIQNIQGNENKYITRYPYHQ